MSPKDDTVALEVELLDSGGEDTMQQNDKMSELVSLGFYAIIFLLGMLGNTLVIVVVVRKRHMRTITNLFIVNLAIADIMMCSLAVPFTPLTALMDSWVFGDAICHILPMALGVSVYVSTLTSTAIAIDRYLVIVHPFIPRMKTWLCGMVICVIWSVACLISLPLAAYQQVNLNNGSYVCQESWPKMESKKIFTLSSFVLQFLVPCCVITHCYWKVSVVLKRRLHAKLSRCSMNVDRDIQEIRRKRRTNTMLIVMVCIFVFCWVPLNVLHIIVEFDEQLQHSSHFITLFLITHVIAMSSTVYNVFIYAYMNDAFKKELQTLLGERGYRIIICFCFRPVRRDQSASSFAGGGSIVKEKNGGVALSSQSRDFSRRTESETPSRDAIELHSANAKCAIAINLLDPNAANVGVTVARDAELRPDGVKRVNGAHKPISPHWSERTTSTSVATDALDD